MHWLREFFRRISTLLHRGRFDCDLEEEISFHLEMQAREKEEDGMSPDEARYAARRQFGNPTRLHEISRDAWSWAPLETMLQDLRYAVRAIRKNPGFAAVAVLTLALGIGASTAVFAVVNAVLLRPLPFGHPERLVMLWEKWTARGEERVVVSPANFSDWRKQSRAFERMAAIQGASAVMLLAGERVEIPGVAVTGDFFAALGVEPSNGRAFLPEEERQGAPAVILSHSLWQRLGADPNLVGKTVLLDRQLHTVIGIMPSGFRFPGESEIWLPLAAGSERGNRNLRVIGKLAPGVSLAQAQSEMNTIAARLARAWPREDAGTGVTLVPLMEQIVGDVRRTLLVLLGAVACLLLIACANVANLLLVRGTARRRELALRLSLGASRARIIRGLLVESTLLALTASAFGAVAAAWLVRAFVALDPVHLPRVAEIAVDRGALLYALAAALLSGVVFGIVPALRTSRHDLSSLLKQGAAAPDLRPARARNVLATAQIALAVVLLIGAGLLMRSFILRVSVPIGFRPERTLAVELPWAIHRRIGELLERVRSLPGVQAAAAGTAFPQEPAGTSCGGCLEIEGRPNASGRNRETGLMVVTADYFHAAGIPMRRGRPFAAADGATAPKVAIINEALARRDFPDQPPLGRRVRWSRDEWYTVVGVSGDVKGFGVQGDPMPALYLPDTQADWGNGVNLLVRTAVPPAALASALRREMRAWNPALRIFRFDTVEGLLASQVTVPRFYMLLLAGFAALALAVAAVGIYGTINYSVARRTHEIGVRMALGAQRGDVLAMIVSQGLAVVAAGLAIGLAAAWASTRVLESMLFGVRATDAGAFLGASAVLFLVALAACYLPARRAIRVPPMEALRWE